MPLFGWMRWSHEAEEQAKDEEPCARTPGAVAGHVLLRELLWHVEEQERLTRQSEREHRHASGALGLRWFRKNPGLRSAIPGPELLQLEGLCAQVPPVHAPAVLSRFREELATNHILPWELVYVFKQVLGDILSKDELEEHEYSEAQDQLQAREEWPVHYQTKNVFFTPTVLKCIEHPQPREEIPTISGYVDRAMKHSFAAYKDWDLPYHCPVPMRAADGYSTL